MTKQLLVAILGLFTAISVGAQPLQAQITTLDCKVQEAIGACIYNRRHLSQLAAAKEALNKSTSDQRRANPPTLIRQRGFGE
jgi:hypothetical protein